MIDVTTRLVTATIGGFASPFQVAITPNGTTVYVTNSDVGNPSVITIDTATNLINNTITDISLTEPYAIAITPDGTTAYVTNGNNGNVIPIAIPANTIGLPISVTDPGLLDAIAITPDGTSAYVVNSQPLATDSQVVVIALGSNPTIIDTIDLGSTDAMRDIAITPNGTRAYVSDTEGAIIILNLKPFDSADTSFGARQPSLWDSLLTQWTIGLRG